MKAPSGSMNNLSAKIDDVLSAELDPAFRRRARIILENLHLKDGEKILDLGCGRGFYIKIISQLYRNVEIFGIDNNTKYVEIARKLNKNVILGDAGDLPFPNSCFDRVVCSEVLEHINDDNKVISEIHRVLKNKGFALISVPNKKYPFWLDPINFLMERVFNFHVPSQYWWLAGIWADHVRLYTEDEICAKLKRVSLKIDRLWRSTGWGMVGEHFLLYGIGKNIVELGFLKQFNRFNFAKKRSLWLDLALTVINFFDKKNDVSKISRTQRFVNIVIKTSK